MVIFFSSPFLIVCILRSEGDMWALYPGVEAGMDGAVGRREGYSLGRQI